MNRGAQARRSLPQVRVRPMRRDGPPIRAVQVLAVAVMAACVLAVIGLGTSSSFAANRLEIRGARFTSEDAIRSIVGLDNSPNLFTLRTDTAAEQLANLPAVASASVRVVLPSTIQVTLVEREPRLIWLIGEVRYAVDGAGLLFGLVDDAGNPVPSSAGALGSAVPAGTSVSATTPGPGSTASGAAAASPAGAATALPTLPTSSTTAPSPSPTKPATKSSASAPPAPAASIATVDASQIPSLLPVATRNPAVTAGPLALNLPVVIDRRATDAGLGLGGIVDPVNLDAGYRLAGLSPADVGSRVSGLAVVLDDRHGFTLSSVPAGWVAEFGFYAPTVRKVDVIPSQVRDLRSLLLQYGDAHVAWVWLVADVSGNHVNTYLPK